MISLFERKDPWDESLYDIVIPMDKADIPKAVEIITENISKPVVQPTKHSQQAAKDFLLEAQVQEALVNEGHFIGAEVSDGAASLTINKHVLRLGRLEEEPEVMIIDLRMPGIDGFEVLRRVKQTRPEVEVVVLTTHGTEVERQRCMDLGAFAVFQKPVDINLLSEPLRRAKEKVRQNISGGKEDRE